MPLDNPNMKIGVAVVADRNVSDGAYTEAQ
jgi:hypothetical protein